jgi:hypothetical protein
MTGRSAKPPAQPTLVRTKHSPQALRVNLVFESATLHTVAFRYGRRRRAEITVRLPMPCGWAVLRRPLTRR